MKKKLGKLRAIDSGTIYDVTGKLRRTVRDLERGEYGSVTDAVVLFRSRDGTVEAFHFGTASVGEVHHIISTAKNRLEPA